MPSRSGRTIAIFIGSALLVWAYYWYEWRSFQGFVNAVDHDPQFMKDFVGHYYPMGRQLLQNPTPYGGYFYSSFFAVLLLPFGAMTIASAIDAWAVVQVVCIVALWLAVARGLLKLSPVDSVALLVLFALSYPILNNLKWGQVSVLLTACSVAAVAAGVRGRSALAGVVLAFGAAIKFYPALFLIWFVARRDVRACISFVAAFAVFYVLVPVSFIGWSHWYGFESAIIDLLGRPGLAATDTNSQYIVRVGMRWLGASGRDHETLAFGLRAAGYLMGGACLGLAVFFMRRAPRLSAALSMTSLFVAIPFVVKTSWPHYFAYLPVCQAVILLASLPNGDTQTRSSQPECVLTGLSMLVSSTLLLNALPGWEAYNAWGMLFVSNLLLFSAACAVAVRVARLDPVVAPAQPEAKVPQR